MSFMQLMPLEKDELLCRAVRPWDKFFNKKNGKLTDLAFIDEKGLSVDRQAKRTVDECILFLKNRGMEGKAYAVTVGDCRLTEAIVRELPTPDDDYHCEIHGGEEVVPLSKIQAFKLARNAKCLCLDIQKEIK